MVPTSVSLLDRLQRQPDAESWQRLVQIYDPFIRRFLTDPALHNDADDLLQDILAERPTKVLIEGSGLTELSSSAVGALTRFRHELARSGGAARMISLPL